MITFETSRLLVRKLAESDRPVFQAMQGDAGVMKYTTGIPLTAEESARDLAEIIARYDGEENETWIWAAIARSGDFVGTCALFKNEDQDYEIAYRLLRKYWGQGYGQEIADGLIDYCLQDLGTDSVVAHAVKENQASVRILDRSRLTFIGEFRKTANTQVERRYRFLTFCEGISHIEGVMSDE